LTLDDGEIAALPDTGAHDNLCSDTWARTLAESCAAHGKPVNQKPMERARTVQGVGTGTQTASYEVQLSAGIETTDGTTYEESYSAPWVENSNLPGLIGIQKLEALDALIRCKTGEMWFLGKGGVQITPSPGSRHFQMKKARSGHWMLPLNKFKPKAKTANSTLPTASGSSSSSSSWIVPEANRPQ